MCAMMKRDDIQDRHEDHDDHRGTNGNGSLSGQEQSCTGSNVSVESAGSCSTCKRIQKRDHHRMLIGHNSPPSPTTSPNGTITSTTGGVVPSSVPYLPLHNMMMNINSPLMSPRSFFGHAIDEEEEMIFPMTDITEEDEEHHNSDTNNNAKIHLHRHHRKHLDVTDSNLESQVTDENNSAILSNSTKSKPIGIIPKIAVTHQVAEEENGVCSDSVGEEDSKTISSSGDLDDTGCGCANTPATTATSVSSSTSSWRSSSTKANSGVGGGIGSLESNSSSSTSSSNKMASSASTKATSSSSAPRSGSVTHHHHHHSHNHNHRVLNHLHLNIRCSSPPLLGSNSPGAASCSDSSDSQHYHTVHGLTDTASVSNHSPINYERFFQPNNKQRTRSHSGGPVFANGFTQQVRHSALISAGMAIRGSGSLRRQSDTPTPTPDENSISTSFSSKSHKTSPNNSSSFFDSFRPRSTSDGKSSKKPSVIAALKNNFLNRHSSASTSTSNSNGITNGHNSPPPPPSFQQTLPLVVSNQPTRTNGMNSISRIIEQQPKKTNNYSGANSAPISPNSVIDPFSVDYTLYAVRASASEFNHCQHCQNSTTSTTASRPRSRSGSALTMARVFDMFRGRSNSISTEQPQQPCCHNKPTFSHQDSLCDRFEFEDIDENLVYVRFFKFYRCYDIIPISAKLVVFDTQLAVKKAFFALLSNGIRAAPLWDSSKHQFIGMLTITDFIYILRTYYQSPQLKMEKLEEHTLDIWRNMLKEKARPLVSVEPDESLFNAIRMLLHNKVHRLPVIDRDTGNVLYILTHKRILKFLFLFYYNRLPMPSYLQKTLRELPQIGTFENIATATPNTPLIEALTLLVERRISALPIVDKNKVIDVYAKFDVIHLAADKMYQNLDITVKKALEFRNQSECVVKCTLNESLHTILERIVQAEVHRIIVVDNDDRVIGIISLSDLLNFLVLRPVNNMKCCSTSSAMATSANPSSSAIMTNSEMTKSPLVEESGEEASSLCSHNDEDDDDDGGASSEGQPPLEDNCQLTVSSVGSLPSSNQTSSSSSSSSICNNNNNDDPSSPTTSAKMSIMSSSKTPNATRTLTA